MGNHRTVAAVAVIGVALVLAACGGGTDPGAGPTASATPSIQSPLPAPTASTAATGSPSAIPSARSMQSVYFLKDEKVQPVHRPVEGSRRWT